MPQRVPGIVGDVAAGAFEQRKQCFAVVLAAHAGAPALEQDRKTSASTVVGQSRRQAARIGAKRVDWYGAGLAILRAARVRAGDAQRAGGGLMSGQRRPNSSPFRMLL